MSNTVLRGAMAAAAATAVGLSTAPAAGAAGWVGPQLLGAEAPGISDQQVKLGGAGSAVVTYELGPTQGETLYAAVRAPGAVPTNAAPRGFGPATELSTGALDVYGHSSFVDGAGNVTVAYWAFDPPSEGAGVFVRTRPAGGTWGPAQLVNAQEFSFGGQNVLPELAGGADGKALLVTDAGLFERTSATGSFTAVSGFTDARHVAVNASGDAAVFEQAGRRLNTTDADPVQVRVRPAGGAWGAPQSLGEVAAHPPFELVRSALGITPNGTVVAAFEDFGSGEFSAAVRTPGATFASGTWAAPQSIDPPGGGFAYSPSVVVDGPGTTRVTWTYRTYDPEQEARYTRTVPGSGATAVTTARAFGASGVAPGPAIASWSTGGALTASRRPSTGAAYGATTTVLSPSGAVTGYKPGSIALDTQGNGYFAWTRSTATGVTAGISAYDAVAPTLSTTVPATASAGAPVSVSATAADRISRVTVTWKASNGQTATGTAAQFTFAAAGSYTVEGTATDEAGQATKVTKTVTVSGAALPTFDAKPALWTPSYAGGKTTIRSLELFNVKAGDTVKVRAAGSGASPAGNKDFTVQAASAKLVTWFGSGSAGIQLGTGATLTVTVGRGGHKSQIAKFTMQAGKAPVRVISYE